MFTKQQPGQEAFFLSLSRLANDGFTGKKKNGVTNQVKLLQRCVKKKNILFLHLYAWSADILKGLETPWQQTGHLVPLESVCDPNLDPAPLQLVSFSAR